MADGYEIRGKSVRVYFRYEGELCREVIGTATTENIDQAKRLAKIIKLELENNTFDYARHFPNSKKVRDESFGHYAELLLDIRESQVAPSTFKGDTSKFRSSIIPKWGTTNITSIDYVALQQWIAKDLADLSNKSIKEIISLMNQTFDLYSKRKNIIFNPTRGIKVKLPDLDDPDPFTLEEIAAIASTPVKSLEHRRERDLIEFMMWDGCRVSEAIALSWEDVVDLKEGVIQYRHAHVNRRWKVTKTRRSTRTHKLLKPAREALQRQAEFSMQQKPIEVEILGRDNKTLRKKKVRPIFLRSNGSHHFSDKHLRDRFFREHCKNAGVRFRPPSQCRHTFISQMLTLGIVPMHWIAAHVGHTSTTMIQKHYGKWIQVDGPDVQKSIEKALDL